MPSPSFAAFEWPTGWNGFDCVVGGGGCIHQLWYCCKHPQEGDNNKIHKNSVVWWWLEFTEWTLVERHMAKGKLKIKFVVFRRPWGYHFANKSIFGLNRTLVGNMTRKGAELVRQYPRTRMTYLLRDVRLSDLTRSPACHLVHRLTHSNYVAWKQQVWKTMLEGECTSREGSRHKRGKWL